LGQWGELHYPGGQIPGGRGKEKAPETSLINHGENKKGEKKNKGKISPYAGGEKREVTFTGDGINCSPLGRGLFF